jgi:hypothetical protein
MSDLLSYKMSLCTHFREPGSDGNNFTVVGRNFICKYINWLTYHVD